MKHTMTNIKKTVFTVLLATSALFPIISMASTSSAQVKPKQVSAMKNDSYVDLKDCTYLESSAMAIVAGNGGANQTLECPKDKPVMRTWHQQFGVGGVISVSSGGGRSHALCCAMKNHWVKNKV